MAFGKCGCSNTLNAWDYVDLESFCRNLIKLVVFELPLNLSLPFLCLVISSELTLKWSKITFMWLDKVFFGWLVITIVDGWVWTKRFRERPKWILWHFISKWDTLWRKRIFFFIKNYKCSLFSLVIVIKQKGRMTEIFLAPVQMIPGQLIAPGQLTDPGVIFASVHGLTPVTVHMSFSLSRGNFERRVTRCTTPSNPPCRGNFSPCEQNA